MTEKYNYLIVGSGLFGATFAYRAKQLGKTCLVIDKRSHLGGNVYCEEMEGINVHQYGAHIFHTSNKKEHLNIRHAPKVYMLTINTFLNMSIFQKVVLMMR